MFIGAFHDTAMRYNLHFCHQMDLWSYRSRTDIYWTNLTMSSTIINYHAYFSLHIVYKRVNPSEIVNPRDEFRFTLFVRGNE